MAVDPLIARGVQPLDMTNALIGVAGLRQRDRALAQDQQALDFRQNALMQAQQQQEDDDAEWEQAYAAKDWGRMARLDAQTTRILWDREQAINSQGVQGIKIGQYNPGDYTPQSWAQFLQSKDPSVLARQYAPPTPPNMTVVQLPTGQAAFNPRTGQTSLLSTREDQRAANAADEAAKVAASKQAEAQATRMAAVEKKLSEGRDVDSVLEIATPLILQATGSGAGAATDRIAGFFGLSLDGADAIASLKVLQANLMLRMPRMEGPQSDRDVQLYREAAASIGDPSVPREQKQAAVRTIRQINSRYAGQNPPGAQGAPAQPQGGNRMKFDAQGNLIP